MCPGLFRRSALDSQRECVTSRLAFDYNLVWFTLPKRPRKYMINLEMLNKQGRPFNKKILRRLYFSARSVCLKFSFVLFVLSLFILVILFLKDRYLIWDQFSTCVNNRFEAGTLNLLFENKELLIKQILNGFHIMDWNKQNHIFGGNRNGFLCVSFFSWCLCQLQNSIRLGELNVEP